MVETPVLFETFVRSDYARKVWEAIKLAQPKTLYFYSNKGRADKEGEIERNNEIRSWINEIDWDCNLHTWFREECVNQYVSLKGAMDWVFDNEEAAIVLEDDCVASLAFFDYCDQMIHKYKDDRRVWLISGDNYIEEYNPSNTDYILTTDFQIYGWASWRDRWKLVNWNADFDDFFDKHIFDIAYPRRDMATFQINRYYSERELILQTHCWDFVFAYTALANNGLCAIPAKNLVENIGVSGTHNKVEKKDMFNVPVTYTDPTYPITKEPKYVCVDYLYDVMSFERHWKRRQSITFRIKMLLKRKYPSFYSSLQHLRRR